MLPAPLRNRLFERMSVRTMRYVRSIPTRRATGLVADVYDMVAEDFFINGSITSQSKVPPLMAGMWMVGREAVLVSDKVGRATKEAMGATLSKLNDCAYCGDMLVSLVYGAGKWEAATKIFADDEAAISDPVLRTRLTWTETVATRGVHQAGPPPFAVDELPEALGTLLAFHYVNRFSHVVMDGSPVDAPLGSRALKRIGLRLFGRELRATTERPLEAGRALGLLPEAPLPADLAWAEPNPRIASALARWAGVVHREAEPAIPSQVRELVERRLATWDGRAMPLSRSWVEDELEDLSGRDRDLARLILVIAKASFQVDDSLIRPVADRCGDEAELIRILAWASFTASRRLVGRIAEGLYAQQRDPMRTNKETRLAVA